MQNDKLDYWFSDKNKIFRDFREQTLDYTDSVQRRVFIDNNSKVLFVAHLDTVHPPRILKAVKNYIFARGGDDRLGCYAAYTLSKALKADVLLTDNEEEAQSTAQYHTCKDYNWIVNFDREGDDVVTYDLDNKDFREVIKDLWTLNIGAFSDICFLKTQACCMNLGVGYYQAHSKKSFFDVTVFRKQIQKFITFYKTYKDVKFTKEFYYDGFGFNTPPSVYSNSKVASYWDDERFKGNCLWCSRPIQKGKECYTKGKLVCESCVGEIDDYNELV